MHTLNHFKDHSIKALSIVLLLRSTSEVSKGNNSTSAAELYLCPYPSELSAFHSLGADTGHSLPSCRQSDEEN